MICRFVFYIYVFFVCYKRENGVKYVLIYFYVLVILCDFKESK